MASTMAHAPFEATSAHGLRSTPASVLCRVLFGALIPLGSCAGNNRGVVATTKAPADMAWVAPAPPTLPAELQRLMEAVEQLPATLDDRSHPGLVRALRALGEGVRMLGPASANRAALVEAAAARLQRSGTRDRSHAEYVRTALDHALAAIHDAQEDPVEDLRRSTYVASVRAWQNIDADQPLLRQQAQVHLALVTLTNALAVTQGVAPPFAGVSGAPEHRPDLEAFVKHTRRAGELTSAVATAPDWTSARMKTAETLQALAEAVTSAPVATRDAAAHGMVIRFEATRLERASVLDHRRVDWTKAGLLGAVNALEPMVPSDAPIVGSLSAAAARAVQAIDAHATFAFQRPAIQDALRAVVSAYGAIAVHEQQTRRQAAR